MEDAEGKYVSAKRDIEEERINGNSLKRLTNADKQEQLHVLPFWHSDDECRMTTTSALAHELFSPTSVLCTRHYYYYSKFCSS